MKFARLQKENDERLFELEKQKADAKAKQDESDAKAKAEKEKVDAENARLQKEIQDKKDEEIRLENERKAVEKKAQNAPEKDKLKAFADSILGLKLPDFSTDEAKQIAKDVYEKQQGFANWIISQSEKL